MNKHGNESGFTAVEGLLTVLVLAAIGFCGYYVLHTLKAVKQNKSNTQSSVITKPAATNAAKPITLQLLSGTQSTATPLVYSRDTASVIDNIVRFAQPKDWRDDADTTAQGCHASTGISSCQGQTMVVPANEDEAGASYPDYFVVTISAFSTSDDAKTVFTENWQDNAAAAGAYSAFTATDGAAGFKYDFEPTTPTTTNNNTYLEHVAYGISNGTYAAILNVSYFNGSNNSFANKTHTDYGQYAATVDEIARTLHVGN